MSIANEITRLQNAKASLKSSINSKTDAQHQITVEKLEEYADFVDSISTGGSTKLFTGHYDTEGLRTIGWTDEEIQYYQDNGVQWNEEEDGLFELNSTELAGDDSKNTRFLPKNTTKNNFNKYRRLLAIPLIDTSNKTSISFSGCNSLTTIPLLNTSNVTSISFSKCLSLTTIPLLNTSNVTNMSYMFNGCYSLTTIPLLDTSNVTDMGVMFQECNSLTTIPLLNTSNVTDMSFMFNQCHSLKQLPAIDTSNVTDMSYMLSNCPTLKYVLSLNLINVINVTYMFDNCKSLEIIGGFSNLGQAYSTSQTDNYSSYTIDMSSCTMLTEQSLINVLNGLYDIASKGCNTQSVILGSTNLAKLTSQAGQQALSNAQAKGWTIS